MRIHKHVTVLSESVEVPIKFLFAANDVGTDVDLRVTLDDTPGYANVTWGIRMLFIPGGFVGGPVSAGLLPVLGMLALLPGMRTVVRSFRARRPRFQSDCLTRRRLEIA